MSPQWKLPGPNSAYLVVWSYDKAAQDINRHVPEFAVRTALDGWIRSRRQLVREICEALTGNQSLNLSRRRGELRDDQLKACLADAFFREKRLIVLTAEEALGSQLQAPKGNSNTLVSATGLARDAFFTKATPSNVVVEPQVKKIFQHDAFLVLLLNDLAKTRITVPLNLSGKLKPGAYKLFNAKGKLTLPSSGTVSPSPSEWLPPGVSLPAQVDYQVVASGMRLPEIAHRIQATPMVSKAPIGTQFKFWVHMDPELGGTYTYKWKIHQDAATAKQNGVREIIDGPATATFKYTTSILGKHRIICELTFVGSTRLSKEVLEYLQVVAPEDELLNAAHVAARAPKYDLFRIEIEMHNISLMKGGLQDQSASGVPYIKNSGVNPSVPRIAPDFSTYTYTVVPVAGAKTFRWYVRCADWQYMPTRLFHGYKRVIIDGEPAYDLASTGKTATWIIASRNVYTIVCDQFDGSGQKVGTAWYRQVVESTEESAARSRFQDYMKKAAAGIDKIRDGKEVGLQAVYLNHGTGQAIPLTLFVGPAAGNSARVVLVDLMPGVDRIEYGGTNLEAALKEFENGNSYPEGSIKLTVPPNGVGLSQLTKTIRTKGESDFALWSGRVGWASLGLTAVGIVAGIIPGGQPVAMACFIAAGAAGAASGGLSLYDRLQKAEVNGTGVALDVASIAASMIGAASAARALKVGAAFTFAGKTGRFFLYSGVATDAFAGLIISAEGVSQINAILEHRQLSRSEKVGAIVRVLATLALQGFLLVLSLKELGAIRRRVGSALGNDTAEKLSPEVLQGLSLLDDNALKTLAGMSTRQLEQVAGVVVRLAKVLGKDFALHVVTGSNGRLNINGQIKLHPNLLAWVSEEELRQIFQVSRALKAVDGDLGRLINQAKTDSEKLTAAKGLRLRFEGQLRQGEKYVKELGASGQIFLDMPDGARERLFDLVNANRGTGNWMKQASNWALSRKPSNAYVYVALVEMYVAEFEKAVAKAAKEYKAQVKAEVQKRQATTPGVSSDALTAQVQGELSNQRFKKKIQGYSKSLLKAIRDELELAWGVSGELAQPGAGAKIVQDAYNAGAEDLKGRIGVAKLGGGLTRDELVTRIKKLSEVKFASEPDGVYHVVKHGDDLPSDELTGNLTNAVLASAQKTIKSGVVTSKVAQDGKLKIYFWRKFKDREGTEKYMRAIVNVTETGDVSLATYMSLDEMQ